MKQPQEHRVDHERNEDEPPKPCCLHLSLITVGVAINFRFC